MPTISLFYGIQITMNYNEHNPPHFHARYGEYFVSVEIKSGVITGKMPSRPLKMIFEWLEMHREELSEDWDLAQLREPLKNISPLI